MSVTGVTTKLSAMTDMILLGEYMDEMYPTNQPTPADGDDYTYKPIPPKSTTGVVMQVTDKGKTPVPANGDDMTWNDEPLTYAALVRTVYRLQDEVAGLAAQVVELRERMEKWTADS